MNIKKVLRVYQLINGTIARFSSLIFSLKVFRFYILLRKAIYTHLST